jgi:hypothetical protein
LDQHQIAHAKIAKISSGRKVSLASYGIETAADIFRNKILSIPGFGPQLASNLLAWRQTVVKRFKFNPNEPLDPADVNTVRTEIGHLRSDLDGRVRKAIARLQQLANDTLEQRRILTASANASFRSRKQAELDEEAAICPIKLSSSAIAGLVIGVVVVLLMVLFAFDRERIEWAPDAAPTSLSRPAPILPPGPERAQPSFESMPVPPPVSAQPVIEIPLPVPPTLTVPSPTVPALDPPIEIGPARPPRVRPIEPTTAAPPLLDLQDGVWGLRSQRALRDFRSAEGLGDNDVWNVPAQERLFSADTRQMSSAPDVTFVGRWALNAAQCQAGEGGQPPVLISERRATAFGGVCEFVGIDRESQNRWRIRASCSAEGDRWNANVRLTLNGNRLTWSSERGTVSYIRYVTG